MEESSRRVVYQHEEMQKKEQKGRAHMKEKIHRLIRRIPRKIVTIPIHCRRETCSLKKMAASPTVTAPYSEPRTLITATCSIFIPRLLNTKAPVSKTPMPRTIQRTSPRGSCTGCLETRIVPAMSAVLVKRIIHTVWMAPTRGMTRIPSSQNSTAKPIAENMAHSIPQKLPLV